VGLNIESIGFSCCFLSFLFSSLPLPFFYFSIPRGFLPLELSRRGHSPACRALPLVPILCVIFETVSCLTSGRPYPSSSRLTHHLEIDRARPGTSREILTFDDSSPLGLSRVRFAQFDGPGSIPSSCFSDSFDFRLRTILRTLALGPLQQAPPALKETLLSSLLLVCPSNLICLSPLPLFLPLSP